MVIHDVGCGCVCPASGSLTVTNSISTLAYDTVIVLESDLNENMMVVNLVHTVVMQMHALLNGNENANPDARVFCIKIKKARIFYLGNIY